MWIQKNLDICGGEKISIWINCIWNWLCNVEDDYISSRRVTSPPNTHTLTYIYDTLWRCSDIAFHRLEVLSACVPTQAAMLWLPCTVFVAYSEEVVLVGEGLIFLEIVGGICTVSLFPVLLAVLAIPPQGKYCWRDI